MTLNAQLDLKKKKISIPDILKPYSVLISSLKPSDKEDTFLKKSYRVQWCTPVIPALQEAQAGGSL